MNTHWLRTDLIRIVRRGLPWAGLLMLIAVILLVRQLIEIYQAQVYRQNLQPHVLIEKSLFDTDRTPQALFANAVFYDNQRKTEQALSQYAALTSKVGDDDPLRKQAYFNSGNIYMRTAVRLLEERGLPAWDEAGPLVALAKESYQKALRIDPAWSEAKYNYHLALRLAPTTHGMSGPQQYEDEQLKAEDEPSGWPAMPGNPRGMP